MLWCPLGWDNHCPPAPRPAVDAAPLRATPSGCHPKTRLVSISQGWWARASARWTWWVQKCPFVSRWHLPAWWVAVGDLGLSVPRPCSCNPYGSLFPQESRNLFCCLYRSWCHNPVTTVSLCFLTQNYKHAYDLIQKLYPLGVFCEAGAQAGPCSLCGHQRHPAGQPSLLPAAHHYRVSVPVTRGQSSLCWARASSLLLAWSLFFAA